MKHGSAISHVVYFLAVNLSPLVEQDSHFAMKVCEYGAFTYLRNSCICMSTYIAIPLSARLNKWFLLPAFCTKVSGITGCIEAYLSDACPFKWVLCFSTALLLCCSTLLLGMFHPGGTYKSQCLLFSPSLTHVV